LVWWLLKIAAAFVRVIDVLGPMVVVPVWSLAWGARQRVDAAVGACMDEQR
jgi:hypothetical protein